MTKTQRLSRGVSRDPEREARWRLLIGGQAASGLSIRQYCRDHELKESAFYFWRAELARRERRPAFVPVKIAARDSAPPSPGEGRLEITLVNGVRIRVAGMVDRQRLAEVLAAAGELPC
jgi:hypothetical protein